jgi:hypothetical protein
VPLDHIREENNYDKERYSKMLLEATETVLGYFGFDGRIYGNTIRKKNRKWWNEFMEERRKEIEVERNVHDG